MNERISAPEVRVIGETGQQIGVLKVSEAVRLAKERGLDLVEVSPNVDPPVCKIMDFGKFKYEQKKKANEAKKHQHQVLLKEVKFRPKIEKHDYEFKLRHVREFLEDGNKVKITVRFRGREITRPELAYKIFSRVEEDVKDLAEVETRPNREGRTMIAVIAPTAKVIAKAAARVKKKAAEAEKAEKASKKKAAEEAAAES